MAGPLRSTFLLAVVSFLNGAVSNPSFDEDQDPYDDDAGGDGDGYGDGGEDDYGYGDGAGHGGGYGELEELKSISDFESFIDNADASIIGTFSAENVPVPNSKKPKDWDNEEDGEWEAATIESPHLVSLKAIAPNVKARCAYTSAPEVLAQINSKPGKFLGDNAGLYLFRSPWYVSKEHDQAHERFTSDTFTEEAVQEWIATRAQPLVGEFNSHTQHRYTSPVLVIFMDLDFKANPKPVNYVLRRARKVASSLTGKLAFAVASYDSYDLDDYGIDSMKSSGIRMGIREGPDSTAAKYSSPVETSFSGDSLSKFAMAYLAGQLTPYEKPESKDKDEM